MLMGMSACQVLMEAGDILPTPDSCVLIPWEVEIMTL